MHPEKVWIVLVILGAVIIGANLLMLGMAKGSKGIKMDYFLNLRDATRPWKKEDEGLLELSKRVKELKAQPKDEDKT